LGSAGPGLSWRIYGAIKRSTKQEAAVFVFEKRLLEKYAKKDRDLILDALKKGVQQLAKIKHPRVLSLQHPIEESRDSLAFATESCFASLANCLGCYDNITQPIPKDIEDYKLYDAEIRHGIVQLCDGLTFLHNEVKLFREYEANLPAIINPRLEFMAPEYHLLKSYDTQADMFSLGMMIYALYNRGKTYFDCHENYSGFVKMVDELKMINMTKLNVLPAEVRDHVKMLLSVKPELRPDAGQFAKVIRMNK